MISRLQRLTAGFRNATFSRSRSPYSQLFLVSDDASWVLYWETLEIASLVHRLGVHTYLTQDGLWVRRQAVFHASQAALLHPALLQGENHIGLAYLHGDPRSQDPFFTQCYENLARYHRSIDRIQISHRAMRDLVLGSGIDARKVFLIPIGINLAYFKRQTPESKRNARKALGLPESAVIVGSFQKDGVGWGEGLEPKLIKGPDTFLKTMRLLKESVAELFVLLSGPARGYVKKGLSELGIPYEHRYLKHYPDIGQLYLALDVYVVSSREEGGPKAILESMASGIPIVTTRVGQAADLVEHETHGWVVEVEDAAGLCAWALHAIDHRGELGPVLDAGRKTAEANAYDQQLPIWRSFMQGFVSFKANGGSTET